MYSELSRPMLPAASFPLLFVALKTYAAWSALGWWALLHFLHSNGLCVHNDGFRCFNGGCCKIAGFSYLSPRCRWHVLLQRVPPRVLCRWPLPGVPLQQTGNGTITRGGEGGRTEVTKRHSFSKSLVVGSLYDRQKFSQEIICRFCTLWLVLLHPRTNFIEQEF